MFQPCRDFVCLLIAFSLAAHLILFNLLLFSSCLPCQTVSLSNYISVSLYVIARSRIPFPLPSFHPSFLLPCFTTHFLALSLTPSPCGLCRGGQPNHPSSDFFAAGSAGPPPVSRAIISNNSQTDTPVSPARAGLPPRPVSANVGSSPVRPGGVSSSASGASSPMISDVERIRQRHQQWRSTSGQIPPPLFGGGSSPSIGNSMDDYSPNRNNNVNTRSSYSRGLSQPPPGYASPGGGGGGVPSTRSSHGVTSSMWDVEGAFTRDSGTGFRIGASFDQVNTPHDTAPHRTTPHLATTWTLLHGILGHLTGSGTLFLVAC